MNGLYRLGWTKKKKRGHRKGTETKLGAGQWPQGEVKQTKGLGTQQKNESSNLSGSGKRKGRMGVRQKKVLYKS